MAAPGPRPGLHDHEIDGDDFDPTVSESHLSRQAMGGTLSLRVRHPADERRAARGDLERLADRIDVWASRLTRFDEASDLSALNRQSDASSVDVGPTLGAMLVAAHGIRVRTAGLVDIRLLDERLAAETGGAAPPQPGRWWIEAGRRRRSVGRAGRVRFDLDGVGKGWIADRALRLLDRYSAAMVDADGDIALRVPPRSDWQVAIADPFEEGSDLAVVSVPTTWSERTFGVATSGTSVHRWELGGNPTHHLIDPRTGRPARTDVVQASVIAESALAAEALAKAAVIAGSDEGLELHEHAGAWATVLMLENGDVIASPQTRGWLI